MALGTWPVGQRAVNRDTLTVTAVAVIRLLFDVDVGWAAPGRDGLQDLAVAVMQAAGGQIDDGVDGRLSSCTPGLQLPPSL